jgi:MerR family transcriptional regulator/heat shock protein HspR
MTMKKRQGYYSISAVARMFSVHQQTIRLYEREGLISPKRTPGNTRMFTEEDIDRLEEIIYLTHKMGVNLAGVEMILQLQKKMHKLQGDMNKLFDEMQGKLDEESTTYKRLVKQHVKSLQEIKQKSAIPADQTQPIDEGSKTRQTESSEESTNDWDIEYDDE